MGTELKTAREIEEEYFDQHGPAYPDGTDAEGFPGGDQRMLGKKEGEFNPLRATERQVGGSHYKDMRIQPTTFIEQNNIGWCAGNAIKYICRHTVKGEGIKDIEKAIHYLDLLLEREYCYVRPENLTA